MPLRLVEHSQWRKLKTIGEGAQASASLMQSKITRKLAVRKKMKDYAVLDDDTPLESVVLLDILPSSRYIVRLLGYGFEGNFMRPDDLVQWFEYCPGGDLQHAVDEFGKLPEDFIWHCFIQIAHALDIIHNCGTEKVVHADIKPDNIFLEEKYRHRAPWPNLKIGDFGTASLGERATGVHVPCWQGPEIPSLTSAGDIWSLGAIIHWLATGRPPMLPRPSCFPGSTQEWELQPEARRPKTLSLSYSSMLNDYMLGCLEWDPRDRISSRELVDCLERDRPRPMRR